MMCPDNLGSRWPRIPWRDFPPAELEQRLRLAIEATRSLGSRRVRLEPALSYGPHAAPPLPAARPAAVILLFYPRDGQWHLPLALRPRHVKVHAGQVGLPGGGLEPGETLEQCALRELREELGVPPDVVRVVGELQPVFVYSSDYRVQPFVAVTACRPDFRLDPAEVEALLELPVQHLLDPSNYGAHRITRQLLEYDAPHIAFQGHRIWGATAVILSEMIEVLRHAVADGQRP
jgi:8-oxo-dGTP pyrophosphatase MutT (NUDIX family)